MDSRDYITSLGYDKFLRINRRVPPDTTEDDAQIKTPHLPISNIKGEVPKKNIKKSVESLVQITGITQASGSAGNNSGLRITATLSDKSNRNRIMLGICETIVYQDSVALSNVVPYGSNTIANNHKVDRGYDLRANLLADNPSHDITYMHHVENLTGSTHTYIFQVRWRYIGEITQEAVS